MALIKEFAKTNQALRHQYAPHHQSAPILRVDHLTIQYGAELALDDISFELPRAIRLAIIGPNGAGKSTLIKTIAGLQPVNQGSVTVFGEEPGGHICIAYVPQRSQVDWHFPLSVQDVVMMGRIGKMGLLRHAKKNDWEIVQHALEIVNLSNQANRQISELSGGQQQRMFIARSLAQEAELMLMDEPLSGLDIGSQDDILRIINTLSSQGVTILVALHDLKMASEHFDSVLLLNRQLVGIGEASTVFTSDNLLKAYGNNRTLTPANWITVDDACCGDESHTHA